MASTVAPRRALKNRHSFKRIRHSPKARRDEKDFRNTQGLLVYLSAYSLGLNLFEVQWGQIKHA